VRIDWVVDFLDGGIPDAVVVMRKKEDCVGGVSVILEGNNF